VVLDEFESDANPARMASVLKLARSASSGDDTVARGTPDGRALEFMVRTGFLFGGINPKITTAADASRIVQVELKPHNNDRTHKAKMEALQQELLSFSPGWCHHAVSLVPVLDETISVLKAALPPMDSRHELNMATLLAGVWLGLNGPKVPPAIEAQEFVGRYEALLVEHAEAHEADDAKDCLNHLLAWPFDDFTLGSKLAIRLAALQQKGHDNSNPISGCGIKVWDSENGFLVANQSPMLERVYAGTRWAGGAWRTALRRLPGARAEDPHFIDGVKVRCTFVPYHNNVSYEPPPGTEAYHQGPAI
jgi:hypothetical protein